MADSLAPPGSSSYHSNTMTVGDGTWDSSRNSFLLPNLVGLNFQTMRYNGMGNRFKGLPEYHTLILGHGVLAAITFMGIVPLAIFLAKYGKDWPGGRVSFKLHVYLQIITVFLATVILVLGCIAVGPERSLTNPHHGIGVAIYVLILVQFIYGSLMYRRERRRTVFPTKLPFGVWIHKLIGRSTALLAFVQIALGLTLYGSPKILFILYALMGFLLMFFYLALEYYYKPRAGGGGGGGGGGGHAEYSDYNSSYVTGTQTDLTQAQRPPRERKEHHWGRDLLAAGGAYGAYEWWKRRRDRRRGDRVDDRYDDRVDDRPQRPQSMGPPPIGPGPMGPPPHGQPPMGYPPQGPPPMGYPPQGQQNMGPPMMSGARVASRPPSQGGRPPSHGRESRESWEDEKYSQSPERHTWRNRILGATGAFAAYEGARSLFGRRRRREDEYVDERRYGGEQNTVNQTDVSRVEAGQAPMSPDTPRVNMGGVQPMTPSMTPSRPPRRPGMGADDASYDSRESFDAQGNRPLEGGQTLRESMAILGPLAGFREWNRSRKARRVAENDEMIRRQELESEEQFNRRNSNHYPRPQDGNAGRPDMSGTVLTGPSGTEPGASEMSRTNVRPDTMQPPLPAAAGAFGSGAPPIEQRQNTNINMEQGYSLPPPPPGPPPNAVRPDGYTPPQFGSAQMPSGAVVPDPNRLVVDSNRQLSDNTAMNESSAYGRDPPVVETAAATAATEAALRDSSFSPTRPQGRNRLTRGPERRGSTTSASASNLAGPSSGAENPNSPPVSVKVKMHNDGRHVTLRRLNEEEAAAGRAARRQERRDRRRRGSSLSSAGGDANDPPPGQRYRRSSNAQQPMRPSNSQPIANVPPPPPMSSSAGLSQRRDSELNLPPPPRVPAHSISPQSGQGLSPPAPAPGAGLGESEGVGSPGDAGTGTDVSAFADNRRRRRAERARQLQQARGGGGRVEFQ